MTGVDELWLPADEGLISKPYHSNPNLSFEESWPGVVLRHAHTIQINVLELAGDWAE